MKKNKRVIILLSVLILGIGVSLAYFVGKTIFKGTGATTEGRTATVNGSTLDISGNIEFGDVDIYPGHQTLSKVTATATGNNELIAYNLTWIGTNNLNTNLKYKVYVSEEEKEITLNCEKKKKVVNGAQQLNEVCTSNIEELGEPINEGEIPKTTEEQTIKITNTEFITAKEEGTMKYYYIIVEYPNSGNQSKDIGEGFKGRVYGEISNTKADINLVAFYQETEEGKYEEVEEIPKEGYVLNQKETKCNNEEVKVRIENNEIILSNVSKSGTACYLYFDIDTTLTAEERLADLKLGNSLGTITTVTGPSCKDDLGSNCGSSVINMNQNGVYSAEDDFGTSYVFRGTVDNNWVKFGQEDGKAIWWRIIRINGNGTIRLIYSGIGSTVPDTTGIGTQITTTYSDDTTIQKYNETYDDNTYVGFMNNGGSTSSYADAHQNLSDSTIKAELDKWWEKTNLGSVDIVDKIDVDTGFCNDRELADEDHGSYLGKSKGGYSKQQTAYAPVHRVWRSEGTNWDSTQEPTLKCANLTRDLFTGQNSKGATTKDRKTIIGNKKLKNPVGLITSDEVIYAGGFFRQNNNKYWLYTNSSYWTMSPYDFYSSAADVFHVSSTGQLYYDHGNDTLGVRPVINLKADTAFTFTDGEDIGTSSNPYIVQ